MVDIKSAYPKYKFDYKVDDDYTGDHKQQHEHRNGHDTESKYSWHVKHFVNKKHHEEKKENQKETKEQPQAYPKYEFGYKVDDPHIGDNKEQFEYRDGHYTKSDY
ncbi:unnamed protein product [Arctia plantaginis]|uniref:Uncharacterized protein n=1 Tax=Arctia plantaginis TaxID=874455 RepID=A0A8S1ACD3_ARCPL|nr:unnamed protein product [Arctia plantaginis]